MRRASVVVVVSAVLAACAPNAGDRAPGLVPVGPRPAPAVATAVSSPSVAPRIISQAVNGRGDVVFTHTASTTWLLQSTPNELIVRDGVTGAVLDRVPTPGVPRAFGIAPRGDVVCAAMEVAIPRSEWSVDGPKTRVELGAFDRATGAWLWRRPLELAPARVQVSERLCAVPRLVERNTARVVRFDLRTGAPGGEGATHAWTAWTTSDIEVSADGRWALLRTRHEVPGHQPLAGDPTFVLVGMDDLEPRALAQLRCARFLGGAVTSDGDDAARAGFDAALARAGLRSSHAAGACASTPDQVAGEPVAAAVAGTPAVVTMARGPGDVRLWNLRAEDSGPPVALTDPALELDSAGHSTDDASFAPDGAHLAFLTPTGLVVWNVDQPAPPRVLAAPLGAALVGGPWFEPGGSVVAAATRDGRLLRWNLADDAALPSVALPGGPFPDGNLPPSFQLAWSDAGWLSVVVISQAARHAEPQRQLFVGRTTDATGLQPIAAPMSLVGDLVWTVLDGAPRLLVHDYLRGLAVIDPKRRRIVRTIAERKLGTGGVFGLALARSGRDAYLTISGGSDAGVQQIDLQTGAVARTLRPELLLSSVIGAAVLEGGRTLWLAGALAPWSCFTDRCGFERIELGANAPTSPSRWTPVRGRGPLRIERDGAFVTQRLVDDRGVRVYGLDGSEIVTYGALGDGWFAYTPDGRFACGAAGCSALRCTIGERSAPVDDPACHAARRPALPIGDELRARSAH